MAVLLHTILEGSQLWLCAQLWLKQSRLLNWLCKVKNMRAPWFNMQCRQQQETTINSTYVWVDNRAAIAFATGNDFTHKTVKHVTVKVRFLQECVQQKIIMITYIKTNKSIADITTKQSAGPQFAQPRDYALGIIDIIQQCVAVILSRIRACV